MSPERRRGLWLGAGACVLAAAAVVMIDATRHHAAEPQGSSGPTPPAASSSAISVPRAPALPGTPGVIRGRVVHADGSPAPGAVVRAVPAETTTTAGDDGTFELPRGPGDLVLEASTDAEAGGPLPVHGDEAVIVLRDGVVTDVKVVDLITGAPIVGATVAVVVLTPVVPAGDPALIHKTGMDGRALFRAIPGDQGVITASANGYAPVRAMITPQLIKEHRRSVTMLLGAGTEIHGTVVDTNGKPVEGAQVFSSSSHGTDVIAGEELATATATDASGGFRLRAKTPSYIKATRDGYLPVASARIADGNGAVALVLGSGAQVSGHVVDASGSPVAGAHVLVTVPPKHAIVRSADTDATGAFTLPNLPPTIELTARTTSLASAPQPVDLGHGDRTVDLALARDGSVSGVVTDTSGQPVAGAIVYCLPVRTTTADAIVASQAESVQQLEVTDASGGFTFRGLAREVALPANGRNDVTGETRYRLQAERPHTGAHGPPVLSSPVFVALGDGARLAFATP
ncbi:MAG TPA: carboxypeptidase-like regulatory domain-containing protein [Kofleriaceae bacterium]|nr:carboxypeptidase-like regulatory domain-containing protein [Kofleriaceae bacterium]